MFRARRTAEYHLAWLSIVMSVGAASGQPLLIDGFSTPEYSRIVFPQDYLASSVSGTEVLGTERDSEIDVVGSAGKPGNVALIRIEEGTWYTGVSHMTAVIVVSWDGADGSATVNPVGLGGIDLTVSGSQDALAFDYRTTIGVTFARLKVFTDGGNFSERDFSLPEVQPGSWRAVVWPYSRLANTGGAGASMTNVGALSVSLINTSVLFDTIIGRITTTSTVLATQTVALHTDVDGGGDVDPGDTLRYAVVITKQIPAVSGVVLDVPEPVDTGLVVGSVTTTHGAVTSGNTSGDVNVSVNLDTVPEAGATITYDVVVDNPLPPHGNSAILSQGIVSSSTLTSLPTDDPNVLGWGNPTVILRELLADGFELGDASRWLTGP